MTLMLQYNAVVQSLPKVGYFKGIDLWMLFVLCMTITCILEYSVVIYIIESAGGSDKPVRDSSIVTAGQLAARIDKACRILFPLILSLFAIIYFSYFGTVGY